MMDGEFYKSVLDNLYDGVYLLDRERRITYWNNGAERLSGFRADEVMGLRCSDGILRHVDGKGRLLCDGECPAEKTLQDGKVREDEIYLHHKDGHRVPVRSRVAPLYDGAGQIVGVVESFSDNSSQIAALERISELEEKALLDPLTGLANRRFLEMSLRARLEEMHRHGWSFGVLFVDLDHFKDINDTHGHDIGDRALIAVANTLSSNLRSYDVAGRWGGEEFVVVALHVDEDDLRAIAEKLRALIYRSFLTVGSATIRVTVSIGATLAREGDSAAELLKRADRLMYESKSAGRDCVTIG